MASHSTANWDLWRPEIDAYIKDEMQTATPMYEKVFEVETTSRLEKTEVGYSGLGPMVEVGEAGDSVEDNNIQGYSQSYIRRVFRKHQTFTSDLAETDQQAKIEELSRDLARQVIYSRNLNIFGMMRNAFNSSYTWADGKTLVSGSHPLKNGQGSQANTFADGVQRSLTSQSVEELENILIDQLSNSGNTMYIDQERPILFVAPRLRVLAFEIAQSERTPEDDLNSFNYWKGKIFDVMEIPWLKYEFAYQAGEITAAKTSSSNYYDSMWGLIYPSVVKKYFKVKLGKGYPNYDEEEIKRNQTLVKYARDKLTWGNSGFFGYASSKGDSSTYTG